MDQAEKNPVRYNDLYFRMIIALLAAHFIVSFGIEETFFELLLIPQYYKALVASFTIAFILVSIIYYVSIKLDRKYDWKTDPVPRASLQVSLGLVTPSIVAFLLAAIYFRLHDMNILDTVYLKYDFPVIVIFLLFINVYYLALYFYRTATLSDTIVDNGVKQATKDVYIVSRGTKNIPITVDKIAYFFHEGDFNFLRTIDGEDYLTNDALDHLESILNSKLFFRANRQFIVHRQACEHFELLPYGKLELQIRPTFKIPVVISQKRARNFREWMEIA